MRILAGPIDLLRIAGITVGEHLYTADVDHVCVPAGGVYWVVRTVDRRNGRWEICLLFAPGDGTVRVIGHLRRGAELRGNAGAVALDLDPHGNLVLTVTVNDKPGAVFPPYVYVIQP